MPDPFVRKTYLHAVPDPEWPVRFSIGKRTRALQLQSFLKTLSAAAATKTPPETAGAALSLVVLAQGDWRRQLSAPYGWGLTRRTGEEVVLAAPASYQPRLVARFDAVRLRAGQAGMTAPGGVGAFVDTLLGLEWAHALLASRQTGRPPRAWLREVAAAYLYQAVLRELRDGHRLEYLRRWAVVGVAGAQPTLEEPEAFVYPRGKMPLEDLLWTQGNLWLRAAALGETHGWALLAPDVRDLAKETAKEAVQAAFRVPLAG